MKIEHLETRAMPATLVIAITGGDPITIDLDTVQSITIDVSDIKEGSFCVPKETIPLDPPVVEITPLPVDEVDQVMQRITARDFLVTTLVPDPDDPRTIPPASEDGVINQRDFLVTNLSPGPDNLVTGPDGTTYRVTGAEIPLFKKQVPRSIVPTPQNPIPRFSQEFFDSLPWVPITNRPATEELVFTPVSVPTVGTLRAGLLAR